MQQIGRYGLAIHTSTPALGLAIDNFAGDGDCLTLELGHRMTEELHGQLADFVRPRSWRDLKFIAVAKGPGGFTGTRMGVVVARTLAQQLDLPLFAISNLAAYAFQQWDEGHVSPERAIAITLKAQRQQVFAAVYGPGNPHALIADQVVDPAMWQEILAKDEFAPNGAEPPVQIDITEASADAVGSVLAIAQQLYDRGDPSELGGSDRPHWSQALPFYGQHPVTLET
jgi:tRNA threonylcarbamoyl adenosine modification protein YeaZ